MEGQKLSDVMKQEGFAPQPQYRNEFSENIDVDAVDTEYVVERTEEIRQEEVRQSLIDNVNPNVLDSVNNLISEFEDIGNVVSYENEKKDVLTPRFQQNTPIDSSEDFGKLMTAVSVPATTRDAISENNVKIVPKIKRERKKSVAIRRRRERLDAVATSQIVAVQSGYWAILAGMTGSEIRMLRSPQGSDEYTRFRNRMEIYYKKMISNSAGIKSFEEFLENTSMLDIDIFDWGLFNATYPNVNKYPLPCTNRGCVLNADPDDRKPFVVSANTEALLVPPNSATEERIVGIVNDVDSKEKFYDESLLKVNKEFTLDEGYVKLYTHMPSLADFLDTISESKSGKFQREYPHLIGYLPFISIMHIYDDVEDAYIEFSPTDKEDLEIIFETMDTLSEEDLSIIEKEMTDKQELYKVDFAIQDVTCPRCKTQYEEIPINFTSMLFMMDEVKEEMKA